jgi:expansin (peptidoglycan-binding protein)
MTKYIFSPYNNPALEVYVEEDYPVTDISYVQRYMLVELKDYEYDHFVKVENEYNAVV